MPEENNYWIKFERFLLILTFLCTVVAIIYSIRVSNIAIEQAEIDLRPWIVISQLIIKVRPNKEEFSTKFEITNIGKLPAHIKTTNQSYIDDIPLEKDINSKDVGVIVIMPNQKIYREGIILTREGYRKIIKQKIKHKVISTIHIDYGKSKERIGKYYTSMKFELDQDDIPSDVTKIKDGSLWNIIDSDFK